jgi:hypothetical protein
MPIFINSVFYPSPVDPATGKNVSILKTELEVKKRARSSTLDAGLSASVVKKLRPPPGPYTQVWLKERGLPNILRLMVYAKQIFRFRQITHTPYMSNSDILVLAESCYTDTQNRTGFENKPAEKRYIEDGSEVNVDQSLIIGIVFIIDSFLNFGASY